MDLYLESDEMPDDRIACIECLPLCMGVIEKAYSVFLDGRHVGTLSQIHKGLWRIDSMYEDQHVVGLGKDEAGCKAMWWRNWSSRSTALLMPSTGADDE